VASNVVIVCYPHQCRSREELSSRFVEQ